MKLTVLGCAGTFPRDDSPCSGYLLQQDGFTLLIDAGNGSLGALQRHVGLLDVDAVLLSHLHADHCADLVAYSYARRFHPDGADVLPVYGPAGTQDRLCRIFDSTPDDGLTDVYDFRTVKEGAYELGPFQVELFETAHPIECYAPRVTAGGRTITYSADTGASDSVVDAARDADLFLCEATWLDGPEYPPAVHMRARESGNHAARADVARLALIHTTAFTDNKAALEQASAEYAGPIEIAQSGTVFEV